MCREIHTGAGEETAMGESETQGQCVCERGWGNGRERDAGTMCVREKAGAMGERETEGQCVTDMDVYTPLATDGSHEHQEQIL